ncbi:hypothetical protein HDV00_011283 [Rhizophlyctis rosea]|nr:hypothetical protein HDV00_011283 [Rhizophlyctis rosea]
MQPPERSQPLTPREMTDMRSSPRPPTPTTALIPSDSDTTLQPTSYNSTLSSPPHTPSLQKLPSFPGDSPSSPTYPYPHPYHNASSSESADYEPLSQYDEFRIGATQFVKEFPNHAKDYARSLFPIAHWLPNYNWDWFWGDLIAGMTVGIVVVPQSLAYAKLATLPLQYGLYSSFIGVLIYCLFATSKDVTIGPTAVASQLVAQIIASHNTAGHDPVHMALVLSFIVGLLQVGIGMLRLGIIVDFIPAPVIAGFTTGAGIQIIVGQIPGLLGISGVNTNEATYKVLGNALSRLGETKLDAAFGFSSLIFLIVMKEGTLYLQKRGRTWARWVGLSRNAMIIIVMCAISYGVNKDGARIKLVGVVPRGMVTPQLPQISVFGDAFVPAITVMIVCILEHIAVVKSFGRLNGYRGNPNQELIAMGVTNFIGSFLGAYPATGSFTRSAIKSQSGVRTPLAGWWTALIVILAMFALTPLFYYIPTASLSAIIMSAISELITRPHLLKQLWEIQFIDLFAFILALVITFFFSIEIAIYTSVCFAVLVLLYRLARPSFAVLERTPGGYWVNTKYHRLREGSPFMPPPEGVLVVRLEESLTYPNSNYLAEKVKDVVVERTRFGGKVRRVGERLWCDVADERRREKERVRKEKREMGKHSEMDLESGAGGVEGGVVDVEAVRVDGDDTTKPVKPILHTLVLDFSAVNGLDSTGVQMLVDLRRDVETYAGGVVDFRFANVSRKNERILTWFLKTTAKGRSGVGGDVAPVVPPPEPVEGGQQTGGEGSSSKGGVGKGAVGGVEGGMKKGRPSIEWVDGDVEGGVEGKGVVEEGGVEAPIKAESVGSGSSKSEEVDVMRYFHQSVEEAVWWASQGRV